MSRYLFVVPPLTGHINPTVAVAAELARRGHEVAWAGYRPVLGPLTPHGARLLAAPGDGARVDDTRGQWLSLRGVAALKFLWEEFLLPLGHAMVPGVGAAIEEFRPDLVVSDQQALAGPVAAHRAGVPYAISATTPVDGDQALNALPKIADWVRGALAGFTAAHGAADVGDPRVSDLLTLVYSIPQLLADPDALPPSYVLTGAVLDDARPQRVDFPWERLATDRRRVLVSLGTINGATGRAFYRTVLDAVDGLADTLQLILVAPDGSVEGPVPDHVLVRPYVPQLALLPHLDAVVSHGGHNTVMESLAHGIPLVVAPIRDDQPTIAERLTRTGAARQVRFGRLRPADLRGALLTVLDDPAYRTAARALQAASRRAGGAVAAADHLEKPL